jgi:hypothetical protein
MKQKQRVTDVVYGCDRQELLPDESGWRWRPGGCPFQKADVDDSCSNCHLFKSKAEIITEKPVAEHPVLAAKVRE